MIYQHITKSLMDVIDTYKLRNGLIVIIFIILYGEVGSILIMELDPFEALYFTVITIATVGYGDIVPVTILQKLFSMSLSLAGIVVIAYIITTILTNISEGMEEVRSGAIMRKKVANLKEHYILCGYGRVGSVILKELKERNQNVLIIEKNHETVEKLEEDEDLLVINGDATDTDLLKKINLDKAYGMIVATGSDVDNLFIVLTTRELAPDLWIVSRASYSENIKRLKNAGSNEVISPEASGGSELYYAAVTPKMVKITCKHHVKDIATEMKIVLDNNCNIEDIEYDFPGIKEPLVRKIGVIKKENYGKYNDYLNSNLAASKSIKNIYKSVGGLHSHKISGSSSEDLNKTIQELNKKGFILGINLNDEEILKLTKEYANEIFEEQENNCKIDY
ncbi:MAG: NAD-binding protein [Methanobacteriaceae archaeon]|nr:NAD-binding protein [Methanobacteriaceae archaeon]